MNQLSKFASCAAGNSHRSWDLDYAAPEFNESNAWDLGEAYIHVERSLSSNIEQLTDIFFKPDGTKMYVLDQYLGDDINEYDLSTAWDTSTSSYLQRKSLGTEESLPNGVFFKPDGTKFFITGSSGDDVNEYDLTTAWDISTASYSQNFSVPQDTAPSSLSFKTDGTKMFVLGSTNDNVNEYNLSTAWDISTASYSQNTSVSSQDTVAEGLFIRSDGTKMYIAGSTNHSVYEYNLSTAWDVSTSSYSQTLAITPANSDNPKGVFFKPDGSKLFVATSSNFAKVNEYLVGQKRFDVSSQEVTPNGISFSSNGKKMFIVGSDGDDVNEYSLSTAFEITSASYSQSFSLSPVSIPTGIFFKPDGTKMYITNNSDDRVWQYELSTAYDISTASYSSKYFDFTFWESTPRNIYIGSYGTKLYLVGTSGDDVNEFDLSTAWDISTASFVQNFSVSSKESSPTGISFVPDGTGMYITGTGSDDVNEYYLSTAWDISTATHVKTFNINSQGSAPTGLFFKPDGTRFFVVGNNSKSVTQYVIR